MCESKLLMTLKVQNYFNASTKCAKDRCSSIDIALAMCIYMYNSYNINTLYILIKYFQITFLYLKLCQTKTYHLLSMHITDSLMYFCKMLER